MYRITLECQHELWFKESPPNLNEILWCYPCGDYKQIGSPLDVGVAETYFPDYNWTCIYKRKRYVATCNEKGCDYTYAASNFHLVREWIERHYLRLHSGSSLLVRTATKVARVKYSRNSKPPF